MKNAQISSRHSATSIYAHDLSFTYSIGNCATEPDLRQASFAVEPGQCLLITGDSGCGKTTLLKLLNGLAPHFNPGIVTGTLELHQDGTIFCPAEHPLSEAIQFSASVFQNPRTQFFTESVDAELAFGLENLGWNPIDIEERINKTSKLLKIQHLRGRLLSELSGGQLQAVACACALTGPGGLVLLDEPTSNLSSESIDNLSSVLRTLRELGTTVVIAEHRLYFLRDIADKVLYLRAGRIAGHFPAKDFFSLDHGTCRELGIRSLFREPTPQLPSPVMPSRGKATAVTPGLVLTNVRFSYGQHEVIDIPHAWFLAGKVTALVGPNGAGKSTLARLICGLAKPRKGGAISLNGKTLTASERRQACQMVMQDVGRQLFAATAEEEITLGLTKKQRQSVNVPKLLADVGLSDFAKRHPQSLSGGQRQRLCIAAAQAEKAQIYIFDEPTSGVGWRHLAAISNTLRSLAATGAVVVIITHDTEFIKEAATHIVKMTDINLSQTQRS